MKDNTNDNITVLYFALNFVTKLIPAIESYQNEKQTFPISNLTLKTYNILLCLEILQKGLFYFLFFCSLLSSNNS